MNANHSCPAWICCQHAKPCCSAALVEGFGAAVGSHMQHWVRWLFWVAMHASKLHVQGSPVLHPFRPGAHARLVLVAAQRPSCCTRMMPREASERTLLTCVSPTHCAGVPLHAVPAAGFRLCRL